MYLKALYRDKDISCLVRCSKMMLNVVSGVCRPDFFLYHPSHSLYGAVFSLFRVQFSILCPFWSNLFNSMYVIYETELFFFQQPLIYNIIVALSRSSGIP